MMSELLKYLVVLGCFWSVFESEASSRPARFDLVEVRAVEVIKVKGLCDSRNQSFSNDLTVNKTAQKNLQSISLIYSDVSQFLRNGNVAEGNRALVSARKLSRELRLRDCETFLFRGVKVKSDQDEVESNLGDLVIINPNPWVVVQVSRSLNSRGNRLHQAELSIVTNPDHFTKLRVISDQNTNDLVGLGMLQSRH